MLLLKTVESSEMKNVCSDGAHQVLQFLKCGDRQTLYDLVTAELSWN
jgi:pullulanase/glycogen debranching enzyme